MDGNKRTALAATEMFVLLNDRELTAKNDELYDVTIGIAEGAVSKQQAVMFLRDHISQVKR